MFRIRCLILLLLLSSLRTAAQDSAEIMMDSTGNDRDKKVSRLSKLDKAPSFPGGEAAMYTFIQEHLNYPDLASINNIGGRVKAGFIVEKDGSIKSVRTAKKAHSLLSRSIKAMLKEMPKWEPGILNGLPAKGVYLLPVRFQLQPLDGDDAAILGKVAQPDWTDFDRLPDTDTDLQAWTHVVMQPAMFMRVRYVQPLKRWPQVMLKVVINEQGIMEQTKVIYSDHPFFTTYVLDMVDNANKQPMWRPAQKNGKDVPSDFLLRFYFFPAH